MKNYLELVDVNNMAVFIAAEDIVGLIDAGARTSTIFTTGMPPITVNKSHFDIIARMVELGVFTLAKLK